MTRPSLAGIEQRTERSPMSTWTAVPALTAAVRDVLALHKPQSYGREGGPPFVLRLVCDHCLAQYDGAVEYPCPTVRTLAAHLDLTDPEGEPT